MPSVKRYDDIFPTNKQKTNTEKCQKNTNMQP